MKKTLSKQHIYSNTSWRDRRDHIPSICTLCTAFPKGTVYPRSQHTLWSSAEPTGSHQLVKQHSESCLHHEMPSLSSVMVGIKKEDIYSNIFSLPKGQLADFSGAAQWTSRLTSLLLSVYSAPKHCCHVYPKTMEVRSSVVYRVCSSSAWWRHLRKVWLSILLFFKLSE